MWRLENTLFYLKAEFLKYNSLSTSSWKRDDCKHIFQEILHFWDNHFLRLYVLYWNYKYV